MKNNDTILKTMYSKFEIELFFFYKKTLFSIFPSDIRFVNEESRQRIFKWMTFRWSNSRWKFVKLYPPHQIRILFDIFIKRNTITHVSTISFPIWQISFRIFWQKQKAEIIKMMMIWLFQNKRKYWSCLKEH